MVLKRLLPKPNKGQHVCYVRYVPLPKHWNRRFHAAFSLQELVAVYESTRGDEGAKFNEYFYQRQWRENCLESYVASHPLTDNKEKEKQEEYNERDAECWKRTKLDTEHLQRFEKHLKFLFNETNCVKANLQHDLNA